METALEQNCKCSAVFGIRAECLPFINESPKISNAKIKTRQTN